MLGAVLLKLAGKPLMALGVLGLALVAGFGAGVGWEHSGPRPLINIFGLHWSPLGQSLKTQRDLAEHGPRGRVFWEGRATYWWGRYVAWHDANTRCEAERTMDNTLATQSVTTRSEERSAGERAAFNNGYAAGRIAGRATCGANNAPASSPSIPAPDPIGDLASGGVRPPAPRQPGGSGDWGSGAYRPHRSVPADRGGSVPR